MRYVLLCMCCVLCAACWSLRYILFILFFLSYVEMLCVCFFCFPWYMIHGECVSNVLCEVLRSVLYVAHYFFLYGVHVCFGVSCACCVCVM